MERKQGEDDILTTRFNQEYDCLAVGTSQGIRLYSCSPFLKCYESKLGAVSLVQMMYCTSLVSFVGAGQQADLSPRRLRLLNTQSGKIICDLNFVSTILNVKMNKNRLITVLDTKIHIFDLQSMKIMHTISFS